MEEIRRKVVVVGDGACGKTSLLTVFTTNEFSEQYVPTIFDTCYKEVSVEGKKVLLSMWDTAGEEDYDRLRPLSYNKTDFVLICFSIDNPTSLQNAKNKWVPEIKHFLPRVHYFLIGTKLDLRVSGHIKTSVSFQEGSRMARRIKADGYMECSSKLCLGIRQVFENAIKVTFIPKKKPLFGGCIFL